MVLLRARGEEQVRNWKPKLNSEFQIKTQPL